MTTYRSAQQPLALADILVDPDQFDSDDDSSSYALDYMHIQIDMSSNQYLRRGAPSTCSVGNPPRLAYTHPEVTPFSAVSSFNFPATADSTLLTPVSSAGSPPLHHRSTAKAARGYHPSQVSQVSQVSAPCQQPTPPSGRLYFPSYEIGTSSQSPSPMTVHPASDAYDMSHYLTHSPNHHHSPKDDIPPPIPYLGHYTVSGNCNDSEVPNHFNDYSDFNGIGVNPAFIGRGGPVNAARMLSTSTTQPPILTHPDPGHYRAQVTPRPGEIEDLRDPSILVMRHPGHSQLPPTPPRVTVSPARRTPKTRQRRTPGAASKRPGGPSQGPGQGSSQGPSQARQSPPALESEKEADEEMEHLPDSERVTLQDDAEEVAKFIFEVREELVRAGMKGKGMWEEISKRYENATGQRLEKATLQMKLTRAFAKHARWPDTEIEKLKEAWKYVEEKRYKLVLERLKEMGGGKCWNWTPALIESKLIDIGFEEPTVDEKVNARRRRRMAQKRRAESRGHFHHPHHQFVVEEYNAGGLDVMHNGSAIGVMHNQLHLPGLRRDSFDMGSDDASSSIPNYTEEQRDQYIDSVMNRIKHEPHSPIF